jgi:hypothetical protein
LFLKLLAVDVNWHTPCNRVSDTITQSTLNIINNVKVCEVTLLNQTPIIFEFYMTRLIVKNKIKKKTYVIVGLIQDLDILLGSIVNTNENLFTYICFQKKRLVTISILSYLSIYLTYSSIHLSI